MKTSKKQFEKLRSNDRYERSIRDAYRHKERKEIMRTEKSNQRYNFKK